MKSKIATFLCLLALTGCGKLGDDVLVHFSPPKRVSDFSLIESFHPNSWDTQFTPICSASGPEARAIIKGIGIPGGEIVVGIPGVVTVPTSLLSAAGSGSIPGFSVLVPRGDQRVIGVSLLVEYGGSVCNSPNNEKRHLVAGFVGPISIQNDVTLPLSLHTTVNPMKILKASTAPSVVPAASPLRVAKLTGMTCASLQAASTIRDNIHGDLNFFPLEVTSGPTPDPVFVYPVAPNRSYQLKDACFSGQSIDFTTGPLLGTGAVQEFTCVGSAIVSCTIN